MTPIKVHLIGATNFGPYHLARFKALAEAGIELTVVQTPIPEKYRPWSANLEHPCFRVVQPFHDLEKGGGWRAIFKSARQFLERESPDAVVCVGYNRIYVWALSLACRRLKIPSVLFLVGWEKERKRSFLKELVKKTYVRNFFQAAITTGVRSAKYAEVLGIPTGNIWTIGNVIDNNHFAQPLEAGELRQAKGRPYFLSVTRLSAEKNLPMLLEAFERFRAAGGDWDLKIAGTGPEEARLQAMVPERILDHVHWLGWVQYDQLPAVYGGAACFILPSTIEPWGLVVNEAMAAGLPVLVSRSCGCLPELCRRGINGGDFDSHDTGGLAQLMLRISQDDARRLEMGRASREIINLYTLRNWVSGWLDCLGTLRERRKLEQHTAVVSID